MAFMIAVSTGDRHNLAYLNLDKTGWTTTQEHAYQTSAWEDIERVHQDLGAQIADHELTGREVTPLLRQAFPTNTGKLLVVESVITKLVTRSVNLKPVA